MPYVQQVEGGRFVGADLVLVDVRANLVVDVLEGALLPER